jgi:flagellar L-ring protein FlgH
MNKPFSSRFDPRSHRGNEVESFDHWIRPSASSRRRLPVRLALVGVFAISLLPHPALSQSLWRDDSKSMFADKRGVTVGDIITIVIQESTTASKDNKTATSKQAAMDASISTFLYSPTASGLLTQGGQLPALKYSSKNDFSGGGTINNSEKIIARIAVKVVDVMPNKTLIIEGRRETAFGGERQEMVLRGIVRTDDVLANNTVFSYNVADASIRINSRGAVSDTQRKGWFTRIWDFITPF